MSIALVTSIGFMSAQEHIQGVCLTGPPRQVDDAVMREIKELGGEWVCLMPYAYGPNDGGQIVWDTSWQWWGENTTGIQELIRMARGHGLKVMLKPHLWLGHGDFTGDFDAGEEEDWKAFERSYQQYILHYAWFAQHHKVELFCLGTELAHWTNERSHYWKDLIDMVRATYQGHITYAANWDEVHRFPFWNDMDLIGVDAYFPLSSMACPSPMELSTSWTNVGNELEHLSDSLGKKVLFAEVGYRCISGCAKEPWLYTEEGVPDPNCQSIALQAMFKYVSDRPWYAGCFIWKWFAYEGHGEGRRGNGYSPQGRPALQVVRSAFSVPNVN